VKAGSRHRSSIYGALLLSVILAGCASSPSVQTRGAPAADAVIAPQRGARGNPPFYDVLGKRYFVLATSDGYRERGIASWYGRDFHGLSTSSGETYDMHAMTAAHTTLPLPTWAEVTNLANGKRVIVKVNDRGPFVDNRIIDLSYAAATALDMVRAGTTRVEVRALGAAADHPITTTASVAPPPAQGSGAAANVVTPAVPPVIAAPSPAGGAARPAQATMFVQAGAFAERGNAAKLVDRLKTNGFANSFVVSDADGRRTLHRVRVGPLRDAAEFDRLSVRLRALGVGDPHLVVGQ
jgi:rare lipoprotein A